MEAAHWPEASMALTKETGRRRCLRAVTSKATFENPKYPTGNAGRTNWFPQREKCG
jgi:hypothetical protein